MTRQNTGLTRRQSLFALGGAAAMTSIGAPRLAFAAAVGEGSPTGPIQQLNDALLAVMREGRGTPFATRYQQLTPVVDRVFDLERVLSRSVGLSWSSMPAAQRATLLDAFRRYTVASYLANFDSYDGQSFQVLPETRPVGENQVVVSSRLLRAIGSPIALDYVMSRGAQGWRAQDVLTNGTISRVAVQRSDFRMLLAQGGVPALTASLRNKVSSLSGGMLA